MNLEWVLYDPFPPREARTLCSNQSGSGTTSSKVQIPAGIQPLISQEAGQLGAAGTAGAPGLMSQFGANPEQIAGLTPQEQEVIAQLTNQGSTVTNPNLTAANTAVGGAQDYYGTAQDQINQLTSGPIGSSPATTAAMTALNTNVVPQEQQNLALSGAGRGGGASADLTSAREAAYTPLVQQEIGNREAAVGQETGLGAQEQGLATTEAGLAAQKNALTQTALTAQEIPQQTTQAQLSANFQDLMRRYGLEQSVTVNPIESLLGSLFGSSGSSSTTTNPGILGLL